MLCQWLEVLILISHSLETIAAACVSFVSACCFSTCLSLFTFVVPIITSWYNWDFWMSLDIILVTIISSQWWCFLFEPKYFESGLAIHLNLLTLLHLFSLIYLARLILVIHLNFKLVWFLLFFFRQLSHLGLWSEISILYIVSRISFYLKNHLFLIGQIRIICLLKWYLLQIEFCLIWIKFYFGKIIPNGPVFGYINRINEISFELIPFNVFYQKFWIVIIVVWLPYFFVHFF